jgi:hypothetical protein
MAQTATETANNLSTLYEETFAGDFSEPFRITWPELRMMAGVSKLTETYITAISKALSEQDLFLLPFNNYFLVAREGDIRKYRRVPGRLLEQFMFDAETARELDDCEIDEDDMESL